VTGEKIHPYSCHWRPARTPNGHFLLDSLEQIENNDLISSWKRNIRVWLRVLK